MPETFEVKGCLVFACLMALVPGATVAQHIPDPSTVAPEYRAAAEKRRDEILRTTACIGKAEKAKILKRDQAAYINHCIDEAEKAQQIETAAKPAR